MEDKLFDLVGLGVPFYLAAAAYCAILDPRELLYLIFRAVEKAQWFLKQGDVHPFKAIGVVATIIVFASAMSVKEAWTVL